MRRRAKRFRDDRNGALDKSHHDLDVEIEPSKSTNVRFRRDRWSVCSTIRVFTHPGPPTDGQRWIQTPWDVELF